MNATYIKAHRSLTVPMRILACGFSLVACMLHFVLGGRHAGGALHDVDSSLCQGVFYNVAQPLFTSGGCSSEFNPLSFALSSGLIFALIYFATFGAYIAFVRSSIFEQKLTKAAAATVFVNTALALLIAAPQLIDLLPGPADLGMGHFEAWVNGGRTTQSTHFTIVVLWAHQAVLIPFAILALMTSYALPDMARQFCAHREQFAAFSDGRSPGLPAPVAVCAVPESRSPDVDA